MTGRVIRYVGGPLDGHERPAGARTDEDLRTGTYEIVDGWADRADYEPDEDCDPLVWKYRGPVPG